jgi:hypothetical protein
MIKIGATFVAIAALLIGRVGAAQSIDNAAAYALANQIADELEIVRERMGRPYDDSPRLPVSDVSELELYFQAQSVLRKANQLAQELAGAAPRAAGPVPSEPIGPADVYAVLEDSLAQIRLAAETINLTERAELASRGPPISATGVLLVVIDVNRQLNVMLRVPISDAEVFEEISTAVTYAAALIAMRTGQDVLPEPPPFDGYKRPSDVYLRLLDCMDAVVRVAPKVGVKVLGLAARRNVPADIEPGHAYDIARFLVADLSAFASALNAPRVRPALPAPKHIFPTEVYAHAGILLMQLEELERRL